MHVAHGYSLNNDLVLLPYNVSESSELFFHLNLQVAAIGQPRGPFHQLGRRTPHTHHPPRIKIFRQTRSRTGKPSRRFSSRTARRRWPQLVELSERQAHCSLIQCKGAIPNHCSVRSHELRSLIQKMKKRKTPVIRGTARVGMVG